MSCLMPCFYSDIHNFSKAVESGNPSGANVSITFYSLSTLQRFGGLTLSVLAIITLLVGASSLGGANIMGTKAAFAMIAAGGAVFVTVAGTMSIAYLMFVKQVGNYLRDRSYSNYSNWIKKEDYPEKSGFDSYRGELYDSTRGILGRRYSERSNETAQLTFFIEFHRTEWIHMERSP